MAHIVYSYPWPFCMEILIRCGSYPKLNSNSFLNCCDPLYTTARVGVPCVKSVLWVFIKRSWSRVNGGRSSYGVNFGDIDRCIRGNGWPGSGCFMGPRRVIPWRRPWKNVYPPETDRPRLTRDPPTVH